MTELLYDFLELGLYYYLIKKIENICFVKSARSYHTIFPLFSVAFFTLFLVMDFFGVNSIITTLITFIEMNFKIDLSEYKLFIANFILFISYYIIRNSILKKVSKKLDSKYFFIYWIRNIFYDYSNTFDTYFLKDKFYPARIFFEQLYKFNLVISAICLFYVKNYMDVEINIYYYPIISVILLLELMLFFQGYTRDEYVFYVIKSNFDKTIDYEEIVKEYGRYFDDLILFEDRDYNLFRGKNNQIDIKIDKNETVEQNTYDDYFDYNRYDDSVVKIFVKKLLANESIYFNTIFYQDTAPYFFFVIVMKLMKSKNVLFILGRDDIKDEIKDWIEEGIFSICKQPELWMVEELNADIEIESNLGILTLSNLYDLNVISNSKKFLSDVELVVIIEASTLMLSGQIMLENLITTFRNHEKVNYAIFDKNCDGMVDTLSHILKTNITEVLPTYPIEHRVINLFWKAEGKNMHLKFLPGITRYLGVGSELALIALKNNVDNVQWIANTDFPIKDIKWVLNQYTKPIINFFEHKKKPIIMESIEFNNDFFINKNYRDNVVIIEDEYNNMFEMARQIGSQISDIGLVNVIVKNYMLRDYMVDNANIFTNDVKAIPLFVPEYCKTERNIFLLLLIKMLDHPISINEIRNQFMFNNLDIESDSDRIIDRLNSLVERYFVTSSSIGETNGEKSHNNVENGKKSSNSAGENDNTKDSKEDGGNVENGGGTGDSEESSEKDNESIEGISNTDETNITKITVFNKSKSTDGLDLISINNGSFIEEYLKELKIAYFLSEDEKQEGNYLGGRLKGHISQSFLPGQFITLNGKYYEVLGIRKISKTGQDSLIVRRAADLINKRKFYRQLRKYTFDINTDSNKGNDQIDNSLTKKNIAYKSEKNNESAENNKDIEIIAKYFSFTVKTSGFLECSPPNDIYNANIVRLNDEITRIYNHKQVLEINLPDSNENVRITITTLLNEIFKTTYANAYDYICALTKYEDDKPEGIIYKNDVPDNQIYIIEDSILDLGYISSVLRNFEKFLEIIYDYCVWNVEYYKDNDKDNYLSFGFKDKITFISLDETISYLKNYGFDENNFSSVRNNKDYESNGSAKDDIFDEYKFDNTQRVMNIDKYELLLDDHIEKFKMYFRVNLPVKINIRFDGSIIKRIKKVPEHADTHTSSRYLRSGYRIYIDKGLVEDEIIGAIIYELSCIWQSMNSDSSSDKYPLAKWSEIQYMYWIGKEVYGNYLKNKISSKNSDGNNDENTDISMFMERFPISKHRNYNKKTPYNYYNFNDVHDDFSKKK